MEITNLLQVGLLASHDLPGYLYDVAQARLQLLPSFTERAAIAIAIAIALALALVHREERAGVATGETVEERAGMATGEMVVVREVWASNLMEELPLILEAKDSFPYVALDTEFPGFLLQTPRFASAEDRYRDVKHNVDKMKLIQLGLTFFGGGGGRRLTWQINLSDFDVASPTDARWEPSVELLRQCGVDLKKTKEEGVESELLSDLLLGGGFGGGLGLGGRRPDWVTFHGLYDIAYLLKLLTHSAPLPETLPGFVQLAGETLGSIFDAKHVAGFCGRLCRGGQLGLTQLVEALQVQAEAVVAKQAGGSGRPAHHQAGYDSLVTGMVFEAMMERFHLPEYALEGILCGIEPHKIVQPREDRERVGDAADGIVQPPEDREQLGDEADGRHLRTAVMPPPVCGAHHPPPAHRHQSHRHHPVAWFVGVPVPVLAPVQVAVPAWFMAT